MFRLETQYALRVLSALAQRDGKAATADLAGECQVSAPMLAKVLHRLSRLGLVAGRPGPGGGYQLARPASEVLLQEVVIGLEGPEFGQACLFGLPTCSEQDPCPLHAFWGGLRSQIQGMLQSRSIADLASPRPAEAPAGERDAHE